MHRIVMVPFASPYEPMAPEDFYNSMWNSISVRNRSARTTAAGPTLVICVLRSNVDRDTEGVRAQLFGAREPAGYLCSPRKSLDKLEETALLLEALRRRSPRALSVERRGLQFRAGMVCMRPKSDLC
jgi:hypothetical protein